MNQQLSTLSATAGISSDVALKKQVEDLKALVYELEQENKKVKAKNGETIWDVSKREGNTIPHLCHSGKIGYRPDGNCRVCVVEVKGEKTLAAS